MIDAWPLFLAPFAVVLSALAFETNVWMLYGLMTHRESRFARPTFQIIFVFTLLTLLAALIAPWVILIWKGAVWANVAWVGLGVASVLLIRVLASLIQWFPNAFHRLADERRALLQEAERRTKVHHHLFDDWPEIVAADRARFLEKYGRLAVHGREAVFVGLLRTFPIVGEAEVSPEANAARMTGTDVTRWAGAHLFNHLEAVLEMRHSLGDSGVYRGPLSIMPARGADHPEARGEVLFARVSDDTYLICPA